MPKLSTYVTLEQSLESLKEYLKFNLRDSNRVVETVKVGIVDTRDLLPMLIVIPTLEEIAIIYNDGLFAIDRHYSISIIDKAFKIEELRDSLKKKALEVKKLFSIEHLKWELKDQSGHLEFFNFELGREILAEPITDRNSYTQYATIPLTLRNFIKLDNLVVPTDIIENSYIEVLDYLYEELSFEFKNTFKVRWRDVSKPAALENFPALGIFIEEPDEDKDERTSTTFTDLNVNLRIYSSLATREIAFINHIRNVETIKKWVLRRPCLDGRVERFALTSIDYGIDLFNKPFQTGVEEIPVFRSDLLMSTSLTEFKYA